MRREEDEDEEDGEDEEGDEGEDQGGEGGEGYAGAGDRPSAEEIKAAVKLHTNDESLRNGLHKYTFKPNRTKPSPAWENFWRYAATSDRMTDKTDINHWLASCKGCSAMFFIPNDQGPSKFSTHWKKHCKKSNFKEQQLENAMATKKRQMSIGEGFQPSRSAVVLRDTARFVADSHSPYSIVERPSFRTMMSSNNAMYEPMSRSEVQSQLLAEEANVLAEMRLLMGTRCFHGITCDVWEGPQGKFYLSTTTQFITAPPDMKLYQFDMPMVLLPNGHSAAEVCKAMDEAEKTAGLTLENGQTIMMCNTDTAANMVKTHADPGSAIADLEVVEVRQDHVPGRNELWEQDLPQALNEEDLEINGGEDVRQDREAPPQKQRSRAGCACHLFCLNLQMICRHPVARGLCEKVNLLAKALRQGALAREFHEKSRESNLPFTRLQDLGTVRRWKGQVNLLKRVLVSVNVIAGMQVQEKFKDTEFGKLDQWKVSDVRAEITGVLKALEPPFKALQFFEGKLLTGPQAFFVIQHCETELQNLVKSTPIDRSRESLYTLYTLAYREHVRRFGKGIPTEFLAGSALDPRTARLFWATRDISDKDKASIVDTIRNSVVADNFNQIQLGKVFQSASSVAAASAAAPTTRTTTTTTTYMDEVFGVDVSMSALTQTLTPSQSDESDSLEAFIQRKFEVEYNSWQTYLESNVVAAGVANDELVAFMERVSTMFPLIVSEWRKVVICPTSSADSERLFSAAALAVGDLRHRLTPDHLITEVFVARSLGFILAIEEEKSVLSSASSQGSSKRTKSSNTLSSLTESSVKSQSSKVSSLREVARTSRLGSPSPRPPSSQYPVSNPPTGSFSNGKMSSTRTVDVTGGARDAAKVCECLSTCDFELQPGMYRRCGECEANLYFGHGICVGFGVYLCCETKCMNDYNQQKKDVAVGSSLGIGVDVPAAVSASLAHSAAALMTTPGGKAELDRLKTVARSLKPGVAVHSVCRLRKPHQIYPGFIIAESRTHPNVFCVAYSDMMSNGKFSRDLEWVPIVDIYLRENAAQVSEDLLKNLGEEMYFVDHWVQVVNLEEQGKRSIIGFAKQAGPGGIKVTQLSTHTSREDLDWLLEQPFYDKKSSCFSTDKLQRYSLPAAGGGDGAVAGSGATGAAGAARATGAAGVGRVAGDGAVAAGAAAKHNTKKKTTSTTKSARKPPTKASSAASGQASKASKANFFGQGAASAAAGDAKSAAAPTAATPAPGPCANCLSGQGHSYCSKCGVWFCQKCPHSC